MELIVACMAKDEAPKYWLSALSAWNEFADQVIVLNDGSTDETKEIAEDAGAEVFELPDRRDAWGAESAHRAALFNFVFKRANAGDVILWLDADMVPAKNPREIFESAPEAEEFAFPLYDLWGVSAKGNLVYRHDPPYWVAHETYRIWAIRKPAEEIDVYWGVRGIHSGHIPQSWVQTLHRSVMMPQEHALLHYGYFTDLDREQHHERYMQVRRILTDFEIAHAKSIIDPNPTLLGLHFKPEFELERAT